MNSGVIKEVGEALNNDRYKNLKHGLEIPCIGVASWQYTSGVEQLSIPMERFVHSYVVRENDKERSGLERNHTHFLLFDGPSTDNDTLLFQRAEIEKYSRQIDANESEENSLIPIVMVLVEGGPFSIRTICQALISKTPLVVLKGSGRAADLIADLHQRDDINAT